MKKVPEDSQVEILAYSVACLVMIYLLDVNPRESTMWWISLALICLALLMINVRYRSLCHRVRELESAQQAEKPTSQGPRPQEPSD